MTNKKKFVEDQLSDKEKIEFEHKTGDVYWYVTNKRLMRYNESWFTGRTLRDLDYDHIVSTSLREVRYYWLFIVAGLLTLISFLFLQLDSLVWLFWTFNILSLFSVVIAATHKPSYYEFEAPVVRSRYWRLYDTKRKGRELVKHVRKHCYEE